MLNATFLLPPDSHGETCGGKLSVILTLMEKSEMAQTVWLDFLHISKSKIYHSIEKIQNSSESNEKITRDIALYRAI